METSDNKKTESKTAQNTKDASRTRLQELLNLQPEAVGRLEGEDARRLLQALQTCRIELELQQEELRETQAVLEKARRRYKRLFDNAPIGYIVLDPSGLVKQANATFAQMVDIDSDGLQGMPFRELLKPESAIVFLSRYKAFFKNPGGKQIDVRFGNRSPVTFVGRLTAAPHFQNPSQDAGPYDELLVTISDITEQYEARASLESIEWLLTKKLRSDQIAPQPYGDLTRLNTKRRILDNVGKEVLGDIVSAYLELLETSAAVYEQNGDYAFGIFSSGWCRMLDSASRALCGTEDNAEALSCGQWLCHESCWQDASKAAIESGKPADIVCHGGLRIYAVPIMAGGACIGAINFGYGNPPRDAAELDRISVAYRIPYDEVAAASRRYEARPPFIVEIAKKRLQGSARLIGALVESRQYEAMMKKERESLRVTLRSIGDGVITTDIHGKIVLINLVAEQLTGWPQSEAKGMPLTDVFRIVNEKTREACENPVEKVLKTATIIGLANDTVLIGRDGTERIIADSGAPIVDTNGAVIGVVLVFRDITEKTILENELRHAQKMEAVGNLAGGIAHEFNNVLGIIIGNTELAIEDLPMHHPVMENVAEIRTAGLRARDIVSQLLNFSRKMGSRRRTIDPALVLRQTLKLLKASIPSTVRIQEDIQSPVDSIIADATQIHQLVINLCNNAAHAMSDEGGVLRASLGNVMVDGQAAVKNPDLKPGPHVRLTITDTGCGIPAHLMGRIFDPYFTTKEVGKGTGMGLAVVHGIVKAHEGAIQVRSTPGQGTTFDIYFPSSDKPPEADETVTTKLPTGAGRILFVDDEPAIVAMCDLQLTRLGYDVTPENDPLKALADFRAEPYAYDLIISDMTMPHLPGDRFAREVFAIRPGIPFILCTGYSENLTPETLENLGIETVLKKPIARYELAEAVRAALGDQGTA